MPVITIPCLHDHSFQVTKRKKNKQKQDQDEQNKQNGQVTATTAQKARQSIASRTNQSRSAMICSVLLGNGWSVAQIFTFQELFEILHFSGSAVLSSGVYTSSDPHSMSFLLVLPVIDTQLSGRKFAPFI